MKNDKKLQAEAASSTPATVSWHEFAMSCFNCEEKNNLCMLAHRNKKGNMVGWIYACENCFSIMNGQSLDIKLAS